MNYKAPAGWAARSTAALVATLCAVAFAPAQAEESAAKANKPKLVCTKERATGSHLPKRTCMTQAQHEERRQRDAEAAARMRSTAQPSGLAR